VHLMRSRPAGANHVDQPVPSVHPIAASAEGSPQADYRGAGWEPQYPERGIYVRESERGEYPGLGTPSRYGTCGHRAPTLRDAGLRPRRSATLAHADVESDWVRARCSSYESKTII
jgi:hypothetical protein